MKYALIGLSVASLLACAGYLANRGDEAGEQGPGEEVVLATPRHEPTPPTPPTPTDPNGPAPVRLVPHVHARYPHDHDAFTQGLVYTEGRLFESTGLVGQSSLREVEPNTGRVLRSIPIAAPRFAEGLALVGDELVQITWQDHVAFVYGRDDFSKHREFTYDTEGWGLCNDGTSLVMSDGSDTLFFRDPATFAVRRQVRVTRAGVPIDQLNELECVDGKVYANVWQTNSILRVDPATGVAEAEIDATGLLAPEDVPGADVLNGIAYLPDRQRFLITGKLWPTMFEVTFEAPP